MKPYMAHLGDPDLTPPPGAELVLVIDHIWTGKAMLAVFIRRDRRISNVATDYLRVWRFDDEAGSAFEQWQRNAEEAAA